MAATGHITTALHSQIDLIGLMMAVLLGTALNNAGLTFTDVAQPCTIQTDSTTIEVRVGPGTHRAVRDYLPANQPFSVIGKATADDGSLWWRVEIAGIEQAWVAQGDVTAAGGCALVRDVDAPPIVLAPPTPAPEPTSTPVMAGNNPPDQTNPGGQTQPTPQPKPTAEPTQSACPPPLIPDPACPTGCAHPILGCGGSQ